MTNQDILQIAMRQSAIDNNCDLEDFCRGENKIVLSKPNPLARKYLDLPLYCNLISYGNNVIASVEPSFVETAARYIDKYDAAHCFETPNLHVLNDALQPLGKRICFMAEYFLPDLNQLKALPCEVEMRVMHPEDFTDLYTPEWSNALSATRRHLDVLGVGAYAAGRLIGLAGCSADCDSMWQIGVDVLPDCRKMGIASALTSRLAIEILDRGKVPFYCCAWSNIRSVRNAIKSGLRPAWVEMTAKDWAFVDQMNR